MLSRTSWSWPLWPRTAGSPRVSSTLILIPLSLRSAPRAWSADSASSLGSIGCLPCAGFLKSARMFSNTSAIPKLARSISARLRCAASRSGCGRLRSRCSTPLRVEITVSGCLISWATEAMTTSRFMSLFARSRCKARTAVESLRYKWVVSQSIAASTELETTSANRRREDSAGRARAPGQDGDQRRDGGDVEPDDERLRACRGIARLSAILENGVYEQRDREAEVPEQVQPGGRLLVGAQQAGRP